ncbi:MAG: LON peptidase substrate-binding domain-containing protein, partial [Candidatus Shikimatogenerans sp. JK-2022]|nr:LON peptidase substrate-binding domain-containing protein [Candidatus Shikimatogenerans bostrichidophilus]
MINDHSKIILLKNNIDIINTKNKNIIDILLINNIILFPGMILPINIINIKIINYIYFKIYKNNKFLGLLNIKSIYPNENINNIFNYGILTKIIKIFKMPNNSLNIILQGIQKYKILKNNFKSIYNNYLYKSEVIFLKEKTINFYKNKNKYYAYLNNIKKLFIKFLHINFFKYRNIIYTINFINNIYFLIYFILINLNLDIKYKQLIFNNNNLKTKCKILLKILYYELQKDIISNDIYKKVKEDINKQQIEYYLNLQLKAIQERLGKNNKDINYLINIYNFKKLPKEVKKKFKYELLKLKRSNYNMPEYNIIKNYLDFLLNLPWNKYTKDNFNFNKAINILNKYHYGLNYIKNRILEYISVIKLKKNINSPILCFIGPPGVGKTSLGKTI